MLLEQFAEEMPNFCKVGTGHNDKIDFASKGFISVTDSVRLLKKLTFEACLVDEGHHPLPREMPCCKEVFKFSATHKEEVDFRYSLGEAIEQGVLCDYDLTVPVVTDGHPYVCLANLLLSQAGRFRRVLAYCNSIAEGKRFLQVLLAVGLAAWHMNGHTPRKERERVMHEFRQELQKPVHVLVTVQVLGEGVNIPNADTCMFVEPRSSYVSIVQAIGRVLRPHLSKPIAHVVLPALAIPAGASAAGGSGKSRGNAIKPVAPGLTATCASGLPHSAGCDDAQQVRVLEPTRPGRRAEHVRESPEVPGQGGPGATALQSSKSTLSVESGQISCDGLFEQPEPISLRPEMERDAGLLKMQRNKLVAVSAGLRDEVHVDGSEKSPPISQPSRSENSHSADGADSAEVEPSSEGSRSRSSSSGGSSSSAEPIDHSSCTPAGQAHSRHGAEIRGSSPEAYSTLQERGSKEEGRNGLARPPEPMGSSSGQPAATFEPGSASRRNRRSEGEPDSASLQVWARHKDGRYHPPATPRKLKVKMPTANSFGHENIDQLDRFLQAIAKADCRFAPGDIRHLLSRFWIADSRIQEPMMQQLLDRNVRCQLAAILQQQDLWELRLHAVEQFDGEHGRLPQESSLELEERTLALWLQQVGTRLRRQLLPAVRVQKLRDSSCGRLGSRVAKWLDPQTPAERCLKELRQFLQVHHRMPRYSKARPRDEFKLARQLAALVHPGHANRERLLQFLEKEGPIVAKWVRSIRAKAPAVDRGKWKQRLQELVEFVGAHGRMPRSRFVEERSAYSWSCLQRRQLDSLPTELRAELLSSHPAVASFLQG